MSIYGNNRPYREEVHYFRISKPRVELNDINPFFGAHKLSIDDPLVASSAVFRFQSRQRRLVYGPCCVDIGGGKPWEEAVGVTVRSHPPRVGARVPLKGPLVVLHRRAVGEGGAVGERNDTELFADRFFLNHKSRFLVEQFLAVGE